MVLRAGEYDMVLAREMIQWCFMRLNTTWCFRRLNTAKTLALWHHTLQNTSGLRVGHTLSDRGYTVLQAVEYGKGFGIIASHSSEYKVGYERVTLCPIGMLEIDGHGRLSPVSGPVAFFGSSVFP